MFGTFITCTLLTKYLCTHLGCCIHELSDLSVVDEFSYRVTSSTLRNLSASTRGNTCTRISTRIGISTSTQIGTSSWYTGTVIACSTMVVEGPHFTKNINTITPFPSSPLITTLWKSPSLQAHSILPLFQNFSSYDDDDVIAKQLNEKLTF